MPTSPLSAVDAVGSFEPDRGRRLRIPHRAERVLAVVLFSFAAFGALRFGESLYWYGVMALGIVGVKLAAAVFYRETPKPEVPDLSIAAVIPFFNEDPHVLIRCLGSLLRQTKPVDELWIIDDGSADDRCFAAVGLFLDGVVNVRMIRHEANRGKRHAQAHAFSETSCDVILTVDSDTVLEPDAVEELLRSFADPRVYAATGSVRALNPDTNLLTRLIDLRYANAFLYERAAYSRVGSVLCCCGSLSMYRTSLVREHLEDFLTQTFLGVEVQFGDDRRMTNYALTHGRVEFAEDAVGYTIVPERVSHFVRQQSRWNKSFFRETLWVLVNMSWRTWPWRLSFVELVSWVALTGGLLASLALRPLSTGAAAAVYYVGHLVFSAYARSVRFLPTPSMSRHHALATFLLAPVYAVIHLALLVPLRIWSLVTIRSGSWGTRQRGVEVEFEAGIPPVAPEAPIDLLVPARASTARSREHAPRRRIDAPQAAVARR